MSERKILTYEEAEQMLPDSETVHTFRQAGFGLLGANWSRSEILTAIKEFGAELSGEHATNMNHGLVVHDHSYLFIETKPKTKAL